MVAAEEFAGRLPVALVVVCLVAVGCEAPAGTSDSWTLGSDGAGEDGETGPEEDAGTDSGVVCNGVVKCPNYRIELSVTDPDGEPVDAFSGTVEVDDAEYAVECPETDSSTVRCKDGGVSIEHAHRQIDPIEEVRVDLSGEEGGWNSGPVEVDPYESTTGGGPCAESCLGSRGTATLHREETGFAESVVKTECGPADRFGLELVHGAESSTCEVTSDRSVGIRIWNDLPDDSEDVPKTIRLEDGDSPGVGSARICDSGGCREAPSAKVTLEAYEKREHAAGRWQIETPDGETLRGQFDETWCQQTGGFCG